MFEKLFTYLDEPKSDGSDDECEVNEWLSRTLMMLVSKSSESFERLYGFFKQKAKFLTLIRHLLEANKDNCINVDTTKFLLAVAQDSRSELQKFDDWNTVFSNSELRDELDSVLDLICSVIDIFAFLATFKDESFKFELVEWG